MPPKLPDVKNNVRIRCEENLALILKPFIRPVIAGAPSVHTEIQFFQYNPFSSNVDVIQLLMSDPVDYAPLGFGNDRRVSRAFQWFMYHPLGFLIFRDSKAGMVPSTLGMCHYISHSEIVYGW